MISSSFDITGTRQSGKTSTLKAIHRATPNSLLVLSPDASTGNDKGNGSLDPSILKTSSAKTIQAELDKHPEIQVLLVDDWKGLDGTLKVPVDMKVVRVMG